MYRIVQEAVFSIMKHTGDQVIKIILKKKNENIELHIVDDGHGFDTNKKQNGIGLKNMHSRVDTI